MAREPSSFSATSGTPTDRSNRRTGPRGRPIGESEPRVSSRWVPYPPHSHDKMFCLTLGARSPGARSNCSSDAKSIAP